MRAFVFQAEITEWTLLITVPVRMTYILLFAV